MKQSPIRARLIDANTIAANGIVLTSVDPLGSMCRALVKRGYDPSLSLKVWREDRPITFIPRISAPDIHTDLRRKQEAVA